MMVKSCRPLVGLLLAICLARLAVGQGDGNQQQDAVTGELLEQRLRSVESNVELDDESRKKLKEIYQQALRDLQQTKANQAQLEQYDRQIAAADQLLEEAKFRQHQLQVDSAAIVPPEGATLKQLDEELAKRDAELKEKTEELVRLDAEPKRRATRLERIPKQITEARQQLDRVVQELAALKDEDHAAPLVLAKRTALEIQQQLHNSLLEAFEKERLAYEATTELVQVQRDIAAAEFALAEDEVKQWRELANARREKEASDQAADARRAALRTNGPLAKLADEISSLADTRRKLADSITSTSNELEASRKLLNLVSTEFERSKEKVAAVGLSQPSGQVLREKRASLPDVRIYRRNVRTRQSMLRDARFNEYEFQDRRLELANFDDHVSLLISKLDVAEQAEAVCDVRDLMLKKREYLDSLIGDYHAYANVLLTLNEVEQQVVDITEQYRSFIDERVLWIKSTFPLSRRHLRPAIDSLMWLASPRNWHDVGVELVQGARSNPFIVTSLGLLLGFLLYLQKPQRTALTELGQMVDRRGFCRFPPTLRALGLTIAIAAFWPSVCLFLAWRISNDTPSPEFARALSAGLRGMVFVWFPLELLRQICRGGGVGDCHLGWSSAMDDTIRRHLRWLILLGLPFLLVSLTLDYETISAQRADSLGRIALIVFLCLVSLAAERVLRSKNGVLRSLASMRPGPWSRRLRFVASLAIVACPLLLAILAALGFYDTAQTLAVRLFETGCLALALVLLNAVLSRWVLMRRRRLAMDQARLRRASLQADSSPGSEGSGAAPATDAVEEVNLSSVSQQTVSLMRTTVFVIGLVCVWLVWDDVLPALSILRNYPAWPGTDLTIADILLTTATLMITYVAARNVHGLVELTFLAYLPVDAGARFATTTLCRYLVAVTGIVLACRLVGITWSSVQWLIAAMGIGLGFGLQEIFANFISGLILLFERPVRVGDTITLGETSGVVTRIRMRATTILDPDQKEFIVPNKDLVTGRLLNWTLSDTRNRIVIAVGVAYGTDVQQACDLLLKAALDHPLILKDPAPVATFQEFGDSTLRLVLRCFLPDLEQRLQTIHQLHTAINTAFRQANIPFAFPQHDVHIRTLPQMLANLAAARVPPSEACGGNRAANHSFT
jgi:potassium efflux system protein